MDYLKKSEDLVTDAGRGSSENETAARGAAEIRLLNDLELVLAGGGDITPTWP